MELNRADNCPRCGTARSGLDKCPLCRLPRNAPEGWALAEGETHPDWRRDK
jgi:hypothetical protein